jgi:hypothetical protein
MAGQSESTRFQELFESALQEYARETDVTLAQDPIAAQLQSCDSVDDITILLQERTQAVTDFRARDRMVRAIRTTVSILDPLSKATSLADTFKLVRRMALGGVFHVIFSLDIISTYKSNPHFSRSSTQCMCRPLVHM